MLRKDMCYDILPPVLVAVTFIVSEGDVNLSSVAVELSRHGPHWGRTRGLRE